MDSDPAVVERLQKALAELTGVRATALERAEVTQTALYTALQREAVRQRSRGREQRAAAIEKRLVEQRRLVADLAAERHRARIVPVAVPAKSAVIDGRITDTAGRGLGRLTVRLVDRAGNPVDGVDPTMTDRNGYYALTLGPVDDGVERPAARLMVQAPDGRALYSSKTALKPQAEGRLRHSVRLQRADLRRPFGDPLRPEPLEPVSPVRPTDDPARPSDGPVRPTDDPVRPSDDRLRPTDPDPGDPTGGGQRPGNDVLRVLETLEQHDRFEQIGASRAKLEERLGVEQVGTMRDLVRFIQRDEPVIRDALRLRNLRSTRVFIELVKEIVERLG